MESTTLHKEKRGTQATPIKKHLMSKLKHKILLWKYLHRQVKKLLAFKANNVHNKLGLFSTSCAEVAG